MNAFQDLEPLNSSGQKPSSARAHNEMWQRKDHGKVHFLNWPERARLGLIRKMVIADTCITISVETLGVPIEPEMTEVCHAVRTLALPAFYKENSFAVEIQDYDIRPLLPWLKRYDSICSQKSATSAQDARAKKEFRVATLSDIKWSDETKETNAIPDAEIWEKKVKLLKSASGKLAARNAREMRKTFGALFVSSVGEPNWENLVAWLKLVHQGEVSLICEVYEDDGRTSAVTAAFEMVVSMAKYEWSVVEAGLPAVRKMLATADWRWAPSMGLMKLDDVEDDGGETGVHAAAEHQHGDAFHGEEQGFLAITDGRTIHTATRQNLDASDGDEDADASSSSSAPPISPSPLLTHHHNTTSTRPTANTTSLSPFPPTATLSNGQRVPAIDLTQEDSASPPPKSSPSPTSSPTAEPSQDVHANDSADDSSSDREEPKPQPKPKLKPKSSFKARTAVAAAVNHSNNNKNNNNKTTNPTPATKRPRSSVSASGHGDSEGEGEGAGVGRGRAKKMRVEVEIEGSSGDGSGSGSESGSESDSEGKGEVGGPGGTVASGLGSGGGEKRFRRGF